MKRIKYEAMFLMDPALATDWTGAEAEIRRILERAEAQVIGLKKWDERKLAYTIMRNKRGLYVLTFFETTPDKIAPLERDVQLSDKVYRVLVLRRDTMTSEAIEKVMAAGPPPKVSPRGGDEWSMRPRGPGGPDRGPGEGIDPELEGGVAVADPDFVEEIEER